MSNVSNLDSEIGSKHRLYPSFYKNSDDDIRPAHYPPLMMKPWYFQQLIVLTDTPSAFHDKITSAFHTRCMKSFVATQAVFVTRLAICCNEG